MDYGAALLTDRGKANIQCIADHVGSDRVRFAMLMELVVHGYPRQAQLASWPMSIACERHPRMVGPWVEKMLPLLERPVHQSVHRNLIRSMQFCGLPTKLHGRITSLMFAIVQDPSLSIASRAFSITVAMRMVRHYPDLAPEFSLILQHVLRTHPGPAVASRARKALLLMNARTEPEQLRSGTLFDR